MDGRENRKPGKEEHRRNKGGGAVKYYGGGKNHCGGYHVWIEMEGKRRTELKMRLD